MTLLLIVLLPFLGALLPAVAIRFGRDASALAAGAVTASALALLLTLAPDVFAGQVVTARYAWVPQIGLDLSLFVDALGFLFAFLILGIGLLIIAFARFYLAKSDPMGRFFTYLLLFQGAMLGIVISNNLLLLVVFWELTSLSSFLLIGYWRHLPEARQGARMALAITGGGGLCLIAGAILLGTIAGTYELTELFGRAEVVQASPYYLPALVLICIGCFAKSAQFPLHFWLPHAMAAPTPVSAYLHSATMVKAGVFLLARLWPVLAGTDAWFYLVGTTGLVTMLVGAWIALFKDDLKALLAYSTVSQLGLLTMLLGFGTPMAALVAIFHVINHATFKAALFMSAGIVDHEAGTRDVKRLGGLRKLMPITTVLAVTAAASMAGLPLLNGFLSKEMALAEAAATPWAGQTWIVPVLATLGALLSVAYSFRFVAHVFFGPVRDDYPHAPHDPGPGLWLPPAVLVGLVLAIGLLPQLVAGPILSIAAAATIGQPEPPYHHLTLWHGFNWALLMSVIAIAGGAALLAVYAPLTRAWAKVGAPEAKALFERTVAGVVAFARFLSARVQDGRLQRSLAVFVGAALVLGYAGFLSAQHGAGARPLTPAGPVAVLAAAILAVGALAVVALHRRRFLALILVGVLGLIVSLGFVHLSAPDLALTQISVEIVTIVLLLLALNLLPKDTPAESPAWRRIRDGVLATAAGVGAGAALWGVTTRDFVSISDYHLQNSYTGGGGTNVVNVILVDFRGFDTFGEIIVLAVAALGIYALLDSAGRGASGERLRLWTPDQARSPERHPLILVVATRALLPLALTAGAYIFFRGHNQPGGGFIAGLVVAIALIMQYVASGFAWAQARRRMAYHGMFGWGVFVAGLTGAGAWLFGRPFLTTAFDYFQFPVVGEVELATALLFDVGVFLTVVGAVMLALAQLSRVSHRAEPLPTPDQPMDVDPSKPDTAAPTGSARP